MRKTQNKRTLQDILHYIKVAQRNGVLKESMMSIAKRTGYSNATVHRALQTLDEQGHIRIIPPENPKEPTTIEYIGFGSDEVSDLLQRATYAMDELSKATKHVEEVMVDLRQTVLLLNRDYSYQETMGLR